MYKFIFALFLAVSIAFAGHAQRKMHHVVYLKNGSSLKGNVLAHKDGKLILETADGSQWVFSDAEVSSVENAVPQLMQPERGFINMSSMSMLTGTYQMSGWGWESESVEATVSISTFTGFQFNRHLAVGGILGIDAYSNMPLMPIGIGARGDLLKGNTTLFYGADLGHAVPIRRNMDWERHSGGLTFSPMIGLKRYGRRGGCYFFQFGWKMQNAGSVNNNWGWNGGLQVRDIRYQRLLMGFGLQF